MGFADNRPLLATIGYLFFLTLVMKRLITNYDLLKEKNQLDFNVLILIILIIIGVYSIVTTTTHVVEFSKITIKKYQNNSEYLDKQLNQINKLKEQTDKIEQELL